MSSPRFKKLKEMEENILKNQMSNKRISDDHATPKRVFDYVRESLGIDLEKMYDPCPLNSEFDGLISEWQNQNYINAPYEKLMQFTDLAYRNYLCGRESFILFPLSKSDSWYFQKFCTPFKLLFFPFRIKFVGSNNPAFSTHCLVIMK